MNKKSWKKEEEEVEKRNIVENSISSLKIQVKDILQHIDGPWQAGTLHVLGKGAENMVNNHEIEFSDKLYSYFQINFTLIWNYTLYANLGKIFHRGLHIDVSSEIINLYPPLYLFPKNLPQGVWIQMEKPIVM